MYNKPFDVGLVCGRFHDFHKGHEAVVDMALSMCDRVVVFVGSSQESGTIRNPFNVGTRIEMIKEIYPQREVVVIPLADLTNENDISPDWGKYLLKKFRELVYKAPDVMVYGNDESRSRWFDVDDIKDTTEVILNRSKVPISATQMREALVRNDREVWFKFHNPKLHKHYDRLKGELLGAEPYRRAFDKLMGNYRGMTLRDDTVLEGQVDFA